MMILPLISCNTGEVTTQILNFQPVAANDIKNVILTLNNQARDMYFLPVLMQVQVCDRISSVLASIRNYFCSIGIFLNRCQLHE